MEVLEVGEMPDGTKLQVEDWSNVYGFMPFGSTLASYPKSKANGKGQFSPKFNKTFRVTFNFDSEVETKLALDELSKGSKELRDFVHCINNPKKIEFI